MDADTIGVGLVRPDLLGTYGDGGNARVLVQRLRWRGIAAEIVPLLPGATVDATIRLLVLGGGEDRSQVALLDDRELRDGIVAAVDRGAVVLGVCAGLQVLGRSFVDADGRRRAGLGILDCTTAPGPSRAVGECLVETPADALGMSTRLLTGFENHRGRTLLGPGVEALGAVRVGVGNGDGTDGVVSGHVVGTYLHGPVLARNPALADLLLTWAVGRLDRLDLAETDRLRAERIGAVGTASASHPGRLLPGRSWRSPFQRTGRR